MMRDLLILMLGLGPALACGPRDSTGGPAEGRSSGSATTSAPPPLETVTMEEEEIVPLEEKPGALNEPVGVPCPWAKIWQRPGPKPLPVGGMVPPPKKVSGATPVLPYRKTETRGTPVVEVVIGVQGEVDEVRVLQSFAPPWPDGDAALMDAIQRWKYEPTIIDGEAIPVCTKITMSVEWTAFSRRE